MDIAKTEKIDMSTLGEVNQLTSSLLLCILNKFHRVPDNIPNKIHCPKTKEEWIDLLLHILFETSAMSYRTADAALENTTDIIGKVCGESCQKYYLGSMVDGLGCAMPGRYSDTDIMNVLTDFHAIHEKDNDRHANPIEETVEVYRERIVLNSGSYPCYTKLKQSKAFEKLSKIAESTNHGPVIRSEEREELLDYTFEYDNAIAVQCDEWPAEACSWETRNRIGQWPTTEQIEKCRNTPCYIVPKPHALNANDKSEWRYSFVRQEKILIKDLPIAVKRAYVVSKFLVKQEIPSDDKLSTYHMKTLLMWHCEQKSEKNFKSQSLYANVINFFDFILQNLKIHRICHYFIPENNMIVHLSTASLQDIIENVQRIRQDILRCLSKTKTILKKSPFEYQHLAGSFLDKSADEEQIFKRCQSFCLFTAIEILFKSHLQHFDSIWNFVQYLIPFESFGNAKCNLISVCEILLKQSEVSKMASDVIGQPYVSLVTLVLALYGELRSEISLLPIIDLDNCINTENDDLSLERSSSSVFLFVGLESQAKTTRMLCYVIYELAKKRNILTGIITDTMNKFLHVLCESVGKDMLPNWHLLQRFKEINVIFQMPATDIEICIASMARLEKSNNVVLELLQAVCNLFENVSMNRVLKQLVFAIFLFIENEIISNEVSSQFNAMSYLLKSKTIPSALHVFLFVSATCIFHKIANGKLQEVGKYLACLKTTKMDTIHSDIKELRETFQRILQPESIDFNMAFEIQCCYARECIEKVGVKFVVNVMDDLLKPHHNLGVLSAVGIELTATDRLDDAIEILEMWSKRYAEAPVAQNPNLIVKVFAKLGHLYHIKWSSKRSEEFYKKANIMFQSAIQEGVPDVGMLIGHVLFEKAQKSSLVHDYLQKAFPLTESLQISSYFRMSLPAFGDDFPDVKEIIEKRGSLMIPSRILVIYIAVALDDKLKITDFKDTLQNIIDTMEGMFREERGGDQKETQRNILYSSCIIASKIFSRLGHEDEVQQYISKANFYC